jgi:hypothetical protein
LRRRNGDTKRSRAGRTIACDACDVDRDRELARLTDATEPTRIVARIHVFDARRSNRRGLSNEDYDRLWRATEKEMDPAKRAAQFIRMNDMLLMLGG